MKYLVRCTVATFKDYLGKEINDNNKFIKRVLGDEWEVDKARYEYLAFERNLVELVSIEEDKKEVVTEEATKPIPKSTPKKKKK